MHINRKSSQQIHAKTLHQELLDMELVFNNTGFECICTVAISRKGVDVKNMQYIIRVLLQNRIVKTGIAEKTRHSPSQKDVHIEGYILLGYGQWCRMNY